MAQLLRQVRDQRHLVGEHVQHRRHGFKGLSQTRGHLGNRVAKQGVEVDVDTAHVEMQVVVERSAAPFQPVGWCPAQLDRAAIGFIKASGQTHAQADVGGELEVELSDHLAGNAHVVQQVGSCASQLAGTEVEVERGAQFAAGGVGDHIAGGAVSDRKFQGAQIQVDPAGVAHAQAQVDGELLARCGAGALHIKALGG